MSILGTMTECLHCGAWITQRDDGCGRARLYCDPTCGYRASYTKRVRTNNTSAKPRQHGLSPEDRQALLDAQRGVCACCGVSITLEQPNRTAYIDHDHRCCPGQESRGCCVRGVLCARCNVAVGYIESPGTLANVVAYLAFRQEV